MIIDCHGHYTTEPPEHGRFRESQLARLADPSLPEARAEPISDASLRASIEDNQLRVMNERGIDMVLFAPRASGMAHHVPGPATARAWARQCNGLVLRVAEMFPRRYAPVCQLPQVPEGPLDDAVAELRRCVGEGFVAAIVNPDPSGGYWTSKPLTDPFWFPLYEALVELDVPAMVHVSASCNPSFHTLGAHYLNADTTAFMQLLEGSLFSRFPGLRFVIPHGGGAVPYHWGRYHGLVTRLGRPPLEANVMTNVYFDTCVYHQAGMDLLCRVVDHSRILFGSEMLGAVRGDNPETGAGWDDTLQYLRRVEMPDECRSAICERNARRAYPRLDARLRAQGR